MRVLVIPEDFRKDQYILKPMIKAMFCELGKPKAKVEVLKDPLMGGISIAMNLNVLKDVVERYQGMVDVFLLCVDRDADPNRHNALRNLETEIAATLLSGRIFLAEHAWQELEVWLLAGVDLPSDWTWADIRAERDPKERYFTHLAKQRGLLQEPGEGRKTIGLESAGKYMRVRQLCQEDIKNLEDRLIAATRQ